MGSQAGFIVKVLLFSAFVSIFIKYEPSSLIIPPRLVNVLSLVLLPTLILAIILAWRFYLGEKVHINT